MKKINKQVEEEHSVFGASGSKRWIACPGSIQMEEGQPESSSEASKEGTLAHECLEFLLKNRKKVDTIKKMAINKWDEEKVNFALPVVNYVKKLLVKWETEDLFIETKVDSSKFTKEGQFGSLDIGIASYQKRTLIIGDYKFGAGVFVPVKDNPQLIYYALAMLLKLGHSKFDKIILYVFQPRKADEKGKTIRFVEMTKDEVLAWGKIFRKAVKKAEAKDAKKNLVPGEHCMFCRAKTICPRLKQDAMKQAQIDFSTDLEEVISVPEVKKIKDIGHTLQACEKLQMFINAVKERAFNDAKRGLTVSGYKLVEKRKTRNWIDEKKVSEYAKEVIGDKAFSEPKLISPAQFEKKFCKNKKAKDWLAKNVDNKTGGLTLAPINSKQKEVNVFEAEFSKAIED